MITIIVKETRNYTILTSQKLYNYRNNELNVNCCVFNLLRGIQYHLCAHQASRNPSAGFPFAFIMLYFYYFFNLKFHLFTIFSFR